MNKKRPILVILPIFVTPVWFAVIGCQAPRHEVYQTMLAERIKPRENVLTSTEPSTQPTDTPSKITADESCETESTTVSEPVDLAKAIALAIVNNPELKASKEDTYIAEKQIDIARSAFLPQVSASYNYAVMNQEISVPLLGTILDQDFNLTEVKVQWMICDFGRSLGRLEQTRFYKNIADEQYRRKKQTIIYQTSEAYYNVLRARKAKKVASEAVATAKSHLKMAQDMFAQEVVAKNDVLRAKVQVAEFEQLLIKAANAEKLTVSALNRMMGLNVNSPTQVLDVSDKPTFNGTLKDSMQSAIDHRPEFMQVQSAIRLQEAGADVARAEFAPEIYTTGAVLNIQGADYIDDTYAIADIGIRMNLYTGGRRLASYEQAKSQIKKAVETAKSVSDGIALQVKQAYLGIDEARSRLAVAEAAVSSAAENRRLVSEKYEQSLATPTEVADAETANLRAEQNYYSALYDYHFAIERLRYAVGVNDATVKIENN